MVNDEVAAMLVVHVDEIKIAATKEITDSVVADVNKRFPTKHLGEVTWHMGSEYKRDRDKGTLEISQTQLIRNVVDRRSVFGDLCRGFLLRRYASPCQLPRRGT